MKLITVVLTLVCVALSLVAPASATNIQLAGEQTLVDPDTGEFAMSGSLVGAWYTTSFSCHATPTGARWPCTGTELFIADDGSGWLTFEFEYTGSASGNGRCHHTITSGSGIYSGATGVITMKDRPTEAGLVTTYKGHIEL